MTRFHYACALRWSDLDAFGHVNNSRFLTLYEEARVALMFVEARKAGVTGFEQGVVISRHEVDYLRPVDYTDPVHIELWVEGIRPSRFTISYELFVSGGDPAEIVASRAKTVCVPFDLATGRPRRMSPAEREFLEPWQA